MLDQFTKETGIKTRYDVFDSLETLEAKLLAGHSGYDIVVPSNEPTFSRLIKAGALAEIDRSKVPNWKNLDPAMMQRVEASDPGNRHGAIYLWGSIGLGINPAKIKALAPDAPLDSWALLFDPKWARKIAPCGIMMMDSAIDVVPSVLHYLGKNPSSGDAGGSGGGGKDADGDPAVYPHLRQRRRAGGAGQRQCLPGVRLFRRRRPGLGARARRRSKGVTVDYVVPKEGAEIGFDMLAIPADAPHKDEALAFINFVLRPEIMARITDVTRYPNAIPATRALVESGAAVRSARVSRRRTIVARYLHHHPGRSGRRSRSDPDVVALQGGRLKVQVAGADRCGCTDTLRRNPGARPDWT